MEVLAGTDFFTVEVFTLKGLVKYYVLFFIQLETRRVCLAGITPYPDQLWMEQQARNVTMKDWGFLAHSRYLLRDRDAIFGREFQRQVRDMGICEVLSAPRSPWQRAYIERVIGSIRRECLDHVIVFQESSLRRTLKSYFDYYHRSRTHLSLGKDTPEPRAIQSPEKGAVVAVPQVGGLHHRYERRAA
jgi:transposase InsO family protein